MTGIAAAAMFPLDSAVNISQFELSPSEREMLIKNGFVVTPDAHEQLFMLYEDNWWSGVPSFVTPDLILQLFNLFVSSALRRTEEDKLYFRLLEFSMKMEPKFRNDPRLAAYFGVPCRLLGSDLPMPAEAESLCRIELARIKEHAGRAQSVLLPVGLDYSQFNPRGHYTRSDRLQRYFKAMMWYGLFPFPLQGPEGDEQAAVGCTRSAIKISLALTESDSLIQLWQEIYDVTQFFSGPSEAYTPRDYVTVLSQFPANDEYGMGPRDYVSDLQFVEQFVSRVWQLRQPKLHPVAEGMTTGHQFRVFGQRYLPDTDIMQQLVNWPDRPFPKGLDVFAALGSERAKQILNEQEGWAEYPAHLAKAESAFAGPDTTFWYQNVYYAWLYALQALNEPVPKSAPQFMQSQAWQDKSLNSSLGSWSELRHDAILYATQTYAECGGPDAPVAHSYCEPEPELYRRLLGAVQVLEQGLDRYDVKTPRVAGILQWFQQTLQSLQACSEKELTGIELTEDEQSAIWGICLDVEGMSCGMVDEDIVHWFQVQGTERFMACVADVANSQDRCLEVGVAGGNTIYALVPIEGKWTLTRGAVFSYREFEWPASDRLTDEKWQQMVRDGKAPPPPVWTKSFMAGD
jgi:hypothetical protein